MTDTQNSAGVAADVEKINAYIENLEAELDRFRRPADRNLSTSDPITPLLGFEPRYLLGQAMHYREWCNERLWGRPNEAELSARIAETAYLRITELEAYIAAEPDRMREVVERCAKVAEGLCDKHNTRCSESALASKRLIYRRHLKRSMPPSPH